MSGPEMYESLRRHALDAAALGLPPATGGHAGVAGIVVDVPADGGFATLIAMTDGTASLYTSVGGGIIGAGGHRDVAAAIDRLLGAAAAQIDAFTPDEDPSQPPAETVRVFVLTPSGRRRADVAQEAFWGERDDRLMPVIAAVQDLITAMRQVPSSG
jgi:hypothetical protein